MQTQQVDILLVGAETERLDESVELGGVGLQVFPNNLGKTVGGVVAHLEDWGNVNDTSSNW